MSITNDSNWTKRQDWIRTLMKQGNSCPICHLPLMYDWPINHRGRFEADTDYYWNITQQAMKKDEDNNTNLFGTYPDIVNAEKCHYVASTYIPEITRPMLYETPALAGYLVPDDGFYLFPDRRHERVVQYDIHALIPRKTPARRLLRVNDFLSITGTRWFLGCKDCNVSHTGNHQVALMVNEMYGAPFQPNDDAITSVASVYTLMFDCMNNGDNMIQVDETRCDTWQIELWINYCLIMFLAQNKSNQNRIKFKEEKLSSWKYVFHYAHRDVGLCDFYMSQILAAILYARNDINCDFIWLHQNFLAILPIWAKRKGLFHGPENSYCSLWRLVMSEKTQDKFLPRAKDLAYDSGDSYNDLKENVYWYNVSNVRVAAGNVMDKIIEFTKTWLGPIGDAIDERTFQLDYTGNKAALLLELRSFYKQLSVKDYISIRSMSTHVLTIDRDALNAYKFIEQDSSLHQLETVFDNILLGQGNRYLYRNTVLLAFSRTRVACKAIEALRSDGDNGIQATIADLQSNIDTKWKTILLFMKHISTSLHE